MNCTSRTVKEDLLQEVTVKAFNLILTDRDGFIRQMQENIAKTITTADTMSPDGIQARLDELQKELIRKANNKQDYDAIADEIFRLREQKSQAEADTRSREETQKRIAELQEFIGKQQAEITEFDESLVRKLIQQITVYDDHFTVRFKSGFAIDINE
jgi:site-specific DNA recombinase